MQNNLTKIVAILCATIIVIYGMFLYTKNDRNQNQANTAIESNQKNLCALHYTYPNEQFEGLALDELKLLCPSSEAFEKASNECKQKVLSSNPQADVSKLTKDDIDLICN